MRYSIYLVSMLLVIVFTGCAKQQSEIYVNFLMPPNKISNIDDVKHIKVKVDKIDISGLDKKASKDIANMIKRKISALVYNEQFLDVDDDIITTNIDKFNKEAKNYHGYSKIYYSNYKSSILNINIKLRLKKESGKEKVATKLVTQYYRTKWVGKKYPAPIAVPSGNPIINYAYNIVPYEKYNIVANISAKLYNSDNKLIYQRSFNNITLNKKIGGSSKKVIELPTNLSIVSEVIADKLREIVYDLSPHNESRKLVINEAGDASVVALMKAAAFSEATNRLDDIITNKERKIEKDKSDLKVKLENELKKAKNQKEKDELKKKYTQKEKDLYKSLAPDYENMGILMEALGEFEDAKYWYKKSITIGNISKRVKNSLKRVKDIINKQKILKKMNAHNKYTYKNQDNKDR